MQKLTLLMRIRSSSLKWSRVFVPVLSLFYFCGGTQGTTLVVSYDPVNGAIIGTDSSVTTATVAEFHRTHRGNAKAECKISSCGRYLIASSGVDVTGGQEVARICTDLAKGAHDQEMVLAVIERRAMSLATSYLRDLARNNLTPNIGEEIFSIAIAGHEKGTPILTFDTAIYNQGGRLVLGTARCPRDPGCDAFRKLGGAQNAIDAATKKGTYPKETNPLRLTEALIKIEIKDHLKDRLVMEPISIVQFKGPTPAWYRPGLCLSPAKSTTKK